MAQDLSQEIAKTRRTRRRTDSNPRIPLFVIWVILISTQLPSSSPAHHHHHHHHDSIPSSRKAEFFRTAAPHFHAAARSRAAGEGNLYDEDKRLVHTGPNPLHN
ncbi:unnamed protein product [Lactuca virosa]|uniref:Uncharacterized protein n=1 Tax=Lactuca virosa TaxID=75947 RepID=A0AAU9LL62_9ASTR|nr:unnamed protein product [Lactuca virosa]